MKLVVSEKNIAAERIAEILAVGKPKKDKVYTTPVYRFRRDGEDWVSIGLKGHIMKVDFPPEHEGVALGSPWKLDQLTVLVDAPVEKLPAEKGIIQSLKKLAKEADSVIIATDFDREGELIGADARDVVVGANKKIPVSRVRFSAITKGEIERAFSEPDTLSEELAQAGGTRQDIDLIWGAVLTRLLTLQGQKKMFGDVYSAGRVQTPTLKLIVDREREREAFVPEDYWTVKAEFEHSGEAFEAGHATERFTSAEAAQGVMDRVSGAADGVVAEVKTTRRSVKAPVPFNTTSLMAAAASEGLSPAQTMRVAESLYIAGHISYPRVDNTVYPPSLDLKAILKTLREVPQFAEHARMLLGKDALKATRGEKETTDHPPIHPTGAPDPERLEPQAWKLYNLVARRFMATLSDPAVVEATRVDIDVAGERFVARGDVMISPGFRAIYKYGLKSEEHLPLMAQGDRPAFKGATSDAKQTQPTARFSQGKLIQEMEKQGLGTKATRHDIIQTLYDRKYVEADPVAPTCRGRAIIEALESHAERITSPEMTRELDAEMDAIANARATKDAVVTHSRALLAPAVKALLEHGADVGEKLKAAADEDAKVGKCPKSGGDLLIKFSPKNKSYFVGCADYPDCDKTYPLPQKAKYQALDEVCEVSRERDGVTSPCGAPRIRIIQFKQRPLEKCLDPECPSNNEPQIDIGACPTGDGGRIMAIRNPTTLKRYARCTNYDECKTSYPLPARGDIVATGETCDQLAGEAKDACCASPVIDIITPGRAPWRICVNPDCSTREQGKKTGRGSAKGRAPRARKGARSSRPKE